MSDNDRYENEGSGAGFMMGLLTGTVLGAGLGILLAPRAGSELRGAIGAQARTFGNKASEHYRRASDQASGWAEKGKDFVEKGKDFVDRAREAVSRGADEARGFANTAAGTNAHGTTGSTTDFGRS
jgi:gas vesicle protein